MARKRASYPHGNSKQIGHPDHRQAQEGLLSKTLSSVEGRPNGNSKSNFDYDYDNDLRVEIQLFVLVLVLVIETAE